VIERLLVGAKTSSFMNDSPYISQIQPKVNDCRERSLTYDLDAGHAWYLVHCKPNSEQMALRNLENQDFTAFLPLQKLTNRKSSGFQTRIRPLFPGYMFVAQDPIAGQWRKINSTRGVARLVCLAAEPTPVPLLIMNELFERCDANGVFQRSEKLVNGDVVKISQGPFSGMIGKIVEIEPSHRVHLLLDFLGQKSRMAIDSRGVIPIS
jgi:transcriptional antiterminator RfaH